LAPCRTVRRLIVNADDFGRSHSINAAVIRAHREGILTTASLMVNETACDEAVALARENPRLGVGLHLTLLCGHSALPAGRIPGLVNERQEFREDPVRAGFHYFAHRGLRAQLREELAAQFAKFFATGLILDHVNGHLHFHLHPVVFSLLMEHAAEWGITHLRLTRDRFWLNAQLAKGRGSSAPSSR
jgi:hopanoid biosynthesis associated protein HpnK